MKMQGAQLNRRDLEVLAMLSEGLSEVEIARRLLIGPEVVRKCVGRIASAASDEPDSLKSKYEQALRRQLEQAHRALEGRFAALLEVAQESVLIINGRTGIIHRANEHSANLFGFQVEQLVGMSVELLVPDEYRAKHPAFRIAFLASIRKREIGHHPPIFALRRDGSRVELAIALTASSVDDDVMVVCTEYERWMELQSQMQSGAAEHS